MTSVTLKGNAVQLVGEPLQVGQDAPDFNLQLANDLSDCTLATHSGKNRILCAVPSLDTPVCDVEMQRFNKEAAGLDNTVVICVSTDLPFAQKRCANNADNVVAASDHREASFGKSYGCLVSGGPLDRFLCRAVFVVGADNKVKHVEYVSEIGEEPDYAAALSAAKS